MIEVIIIMIITMFIIVSAVGIAIILRVLWLYAFYDMDDDISMCEDSLVD